MRTKDFRKNKVNVVTLGCSKNLVDSEVLLGQLKGNQIEAEHQSTGNDCNIVVVNTCGFIDRAKEESINTILHYIDEKAAGNIERLYVTGCLSERYKDNLQTEMPEVDAYFGTLELPGLLSKLGADYKHELIGERTLTTAPHFAYLKISEGCNRTCSFCAIPLMRGKHISKTIEAIISEAEGLVKNGVKEVILIAQELTYYGLDIYKKRQLAELLNQLSAVEGLAWIRLHYAYPHNFPLDVLDVMAKHSNICNYIDIPLQHAADNVLQAMRRQITLAETEELLATIRAKVPAIGIRTTMLVGFPGETEEDFDTLMQFVKKQKFERLGVFAYSHEENTSAHDLVDDVPEAVKLDRVNRLMELQQEISFEINQEKIGKQYKVLFDRKEGEYFVGRTEYDSPEVDNEVLVDAREHFVRIGDYAEVTITDATEFDLYGKL